MGGLAETFTRTLDSATMLARLSALRAVASGAAVKAPFAAPATFARAVQPVCNRQGKHPCDCVILLIPPVVHGDAPCYPQLNWTRLRPARGNAGSV